MSVEFAECLAGSAQHLQALGSAIETTREFAREHPELTPGEAADRIMGALSDEQLTALAREQVRDIVRNSQRTYAQQVERQAERPYSSTPGVTWFEPGFAPAPGTCLPGGGRCREARLSLGLSMASVAKQAGCSQATVQQVELNRGVPARNVREGIAAAVQLSEEDIWPGELARDLERERTSEARMEARFGEVRDHPGKRSWLTRRAEREEFRRWMGDRFQEWYEKGLQATDDEHIFRADWHPCGWDAYWAEFRMNEITRLVGRVADQTRLEVTAELLGTTFALGNSTERVTWGEATTDQHRQRIESLAGKAAGNVETAARHAAAVRMIEEAGVSCLREVPDGERSSGEPLR